MQAKIDNQARCMQLLAAAGAERLASYARRVRLGDTGIWEAQASAYYFPQLFVAATAAKRAGSTPH